MFETVNGGMLPQRQTAHSAGFDVFANEDMEICVGDTKILSLGIKLTDEGIKKVINNALSKSGLPSLDDEAAKELFYNQYYLELHPRSSLRAKGLIVMPGIIDMDYRDEIQMIIHNGNAVSKIPPDLSAHLDAMLSRKETCDKYFKIKKGDKVGQLIFLRHQGYLLPLEYTKDEKRTGGIGSTGE